MRVTRNDTKRFSQAFVIHRVVNDNKETTIGPGISALIIAKPLVRGGTCLFRAIFTGPPVQIPNINEGNKIISQKAGFSCV
jgi:hypothetical protein